MRIFQRGQAMVEYTVVVAALVTAVMITPVSGDMNAIEWLLRTMKNNYEGYSFNISGVQYYEPEKPVPIP
jgi:Flp pilus assembly pilin Flp